MTMRGFDDEWDYIDSGMGQEDFKCCESFLPYMHGMQILWDCLLKVTIRYRHVDDTNNGCGILCTY